MTSPFGLKWKGKITSHMPLSFSPPPSTSTRYKDIFDMLSASKISGYHVPEDDIIIHKKVTAIVNCYIDSVVIPKVQVSQPAP